MCAYSKEGKVATPGNKGGSLYCDRYPISNNKLTSKILAGVACHGDKCKKKRSDLYTAFSYFYNFIKDIKCLEKEL